MTSGYGRVEVASELRLVPRPEVRLGVADRGVGLARTRARARGLATMGMNIPRLTTVHARARTRGGAVDNFRHRFLSLCWFLFSSPAVTRLRGNSHVCRAGQPADEKSPSGTKPEGLKWT